MKLCELENIYRQFKDNWFNGVLKENDLFEFLQNLGGAGEDRLLRERQLHQESVFKNNLRLQIYDLLMATARQRQLKILFIENNPDRKLVEVDERFNSILRESKLNATLKETLLASIENTGGSIYIYSGDFYDFYQKLLRIKHRKKLDDAPEIIIACTRIDDDVESKHSLAEFDLILVDIVLSENKNDVKVIDGIDFVNVLRELYPEIPVFIFSILSDYNTIRKSFFKGADFYLIKS